MRTNARIDMSLAIRITFGLRTVVARIGGGIAVDRIVIEYANNFSHFWFTFDVGEELKAPCRRIRLFRGRPGKAIVGLALVYVQSFANMV